MNKAQGRRQQKQTKKPAKNQKRGRPAAASDLQALLQEGLEIGGRCRMAAFLVFCRLFRLFLLAASLCLVHPIGDLKRKSVSK